MYIESLNGTYTLWDELTGPISPSLASLSLLDSWCQSNAPAVPFEALRVRKGTRAPVYRAKSTECLEGEHTECEGGTCRCECHIKKGIDKKGSESVDSEIGDKFFMAFKFVSRASLPQPTKGFVGSQSITISDKGVITLSGKTVEALGSPERVAIAFDAEKRLLYVIEGTEAVGKKIKDGGLEACPKLREQKGKGAKGRFFPATASLNDKESFGDKLYDYRKSGSQNFPATSVDAAVATKLGGKAVTIELPVGALTPKPKVSRPRKVKTTVTATSGPVAVEASKPAETKPSDELDLELAV